MNLIRSTGNPTIRPEYSVIRGKVLSSMITASVARVMMVYWRQETHLFWKCTFSLQCWQSIDITLEDNMDLSQMISAARSNFGNPFFFEAFATAAWNIWKQRNAKIFDNVTPSVRSWTFSFKRDLFLLSYRMKDNLVSPLTAWLDAL
jgi:hypothetical protein